MTSFNNALEVTTYLAAKGLSPTEAWLQAFLATVRPTTPLPALRQTALFRLTTSDITATLNSSPQYTLPADILNDRIAQRHLVGPITVQILSIHDVGRSAWSQLEAFEAAERGETLKGREVIRVVPTEDNSADQAVAAAADGTGGPHKLVLQDAAGTRVFGFDLMRIGELGVGMQMGAKMVLRNVLVARGVLILEPGSVVWLGGRIESIHTAWVADRKAQLKAAAGITYET